MYDPLWIKYVERIRSDRHWKDFPPCVVSLGCKCVLCSMHKLSNIFRDQIRDKRGHEYLDRLYVFANVRVTCWFNGKTECECMLCDVYRLREIFIKANSPDKINPSHYKSHPSGIECIQITEHLNFCKGNAIKYIWRAGEKGDAIEDLEKAKWYIDREITRLKKERGQ